MQPRILSIETSGRLCSVAVARGEDVIDMVESGEEFDHSSVLAPQVKQLLQRNAMSVSNLDAIAVSAGPGSYTGLRVGASLAKAMCFVLGVPLIAVDTLESLAREAKRRTGADAVYYPNIDARRMEVYLAAFDSSGARIQQNAAVILSEGFIKGLLQDSGHIVFCGSGTSKADALLQSSKITRLALEPKAEYIARVAYPMFTNGQFADVESFRPDYVKAPNITKPASKQL